MDKNQEYCLPGQKKIVYKDKPKPKPHINTFKKMSGLRIENLFD